MKSRYLNFVQTLINLSPNLHEIYCNALEYWKPVEPPITVLLGELGRQIVSDFASAEPITNKSIFSCIEIAMHSQDLELTSAVGTGLIEAIVNYAESQKLIWPSVYLMFGDASKKYADAWILFSS